MTGLQIYCKSCRSTVHNKVKKTDNCSHPPESQVYNVTVKIPNTGGKRRTKNLVTRDLNTALKECIEFNEMVKSPLEEKETSPNEMEYLTDCVAMFMDYLLNEGVPEHEQKSRSRGHINSTNSYLKHFLDFYEENINRNIHNVKIEDISKEKVGKYFSYISKLNQSNSSFNHRIKAINGMYNFLINIKGLQIYNPWKTVRLKSIKSTKGSISKTDFYDLLSVINDKDSSQLLSGNKRNMYRYYLKDLFRLAVFTGRRKEELFSMKWNMIELVDNNPTYIKSPDLKVIRQKNITKVDDFEYAYIPIGVELFNLLSDLNLEENLGKDEFIIAPEISGRKTMQDTMNKQFKFFFSRLNRDYFPTVKFFRKTFVTREAQEAALTKVQHSDIRTTKKHYIDGSLIATFLVKNGFRVYP